MVPCHEWERKEAEEESVIFKEGWAPVEFLTTHNKLDGVKFAKVTECTREDGKVKFTTDNAQTMELDANFVVLAIGQAAAPMWDA